MKLNGRLEFLGLLTGCAVSTEKGKTDLMAEIESLLARLNGKQVSQEFKDGRGYKIFSDDTTDEKLKHESVPEYRLALLVGPTGGVNIYAYLELSLMALNGRSVNAEITDTSFEIAGDPSEKVHGVHFTDGNSCAVSEETRESVCKMGKPGCCIFLAYSPEGFACQKFNSPIARVILERHAEGRMRASRIGNCAILGRKEKAIEA
ncbi:MAG: hypothetical protein KGH93_03070 [Patescibacteria group bacterium]|nr:hypothetical protein [Patescibacteria group bacterium]MDE1946152.1 hypothetical protein [Patescibacteria group bacterium]